MCQFAECRLKLHDLTEVPRPDRVHRTGRVACRGDSRNAFLLIRHLGYPVFVPDRREVVVGVSAMIRNVPCVRIGLVASNCINAQITVCSGHCFQGSELQSSVNSTMAAYPRPGSGSTECTIHPPSLSSSLARSTMSPELPLAGMSDAADRLAEVPARPQFGSTGHKDAYGTRSLGGRGGRYRPPRPSAAMKSAAAPTIYRRLPPLDKPLCRIQHHGGKTTGGIP
jgi:hypothetical protein